MLYGFKLFSLKNCEVMLSTSFFFVFDEVSIFSYILAMFLEGKTHLTCTLFVILYGFT